MGEWIPCAERQPDAPGIYLVTILNRGWDRNGHEIVQGIEPVHDEFWEHHANMYAQMPDGRWVERDERVWDGEKWSGYDEVQLAWMPLPEPYVEEAKDGV